MRVSMGSVRISTLEKYLYGWDLTDKQLRPLKCRRMLEHFLGGLAFRFFSQLKIFSIRRGGQYSPACPVLTGFVVPVGALYLECAGTVFSVGVNCCFQALELASELQGFLSGGKVLLWNRRVERGGWDEWKGGASRPLDL